MKRDLKMKRYAVLMILMFAAVAPFTAYAEETDPQTLVGKPAPQVVLPLLGGGELDLAKHKGKEVVVLDFWASWCPWCRKSTEHFVKVSEKYKGKDVAFYMVAVRDKEEKITAYMKENKLSPKIALDPERKMADPYIVDGIPHIVVIDKEGKITTVAVGEDEVGPAMESGVAKALGETKAPETAKEK